MTAAHVGSAVAIIFMMFVFCAGHVVGCLGHA